MTSLLQCLVYYYFYYCCRIQVFEKNGTYRYQFGVAGKEEGQLWYPRWVRVSVPW